MPGGDRRGPSGFGPMSGRGMGYCAGNDRPGYAAGAGFRGRGFGRMGGGYGAGGMGRGFRNRFYAAPVPPAPAYGYGYQQNYPEFTPQQEIEMLRSDARNLENEMKAVNDRISELESLSSGKE